MNTDRLERGNATSGEPAVLDRATVWASYSHWASGVCVVTTRDPEGNPVGVTATSFSPVSVTPPLISWSLDNRSRSLPAYLSADQFAVHILGEHQDETSSSFARPGADKFAYRILDSDDDSPLLRHCLARFVCDTDRVIPAGDHTLFIGEIRQVAFTDGKPLLYFAQKYGLYALHPCHDQTFLDAWL
ncbi:flavin reductase family protein [Nocardia cyriacigeorgica]|uniref:flavin reductase family protein n=1 Tax=Nocardia cyriacigeorgica TaxID=135487 RepID=UPI002457723A|nr:flavin reductase family protein [Nocardia cyriacigeorgica]